PTPSSPPPLASPPLFRSQSVRPPGLPGYDVHGFAASPSDGTLYAAVNGRGLYRSTNGGASFSEVSHNVGGSVMALAVRPDGSVLDRKSTRLNSSHKIISY